MPVVTEIIETDTKSTYIYDHIVLAIPAAAFNKVNFSGLGYRKTLKKIQSIGYGANYKIALKLNYKAKAGSVIKDNTISFYNHDDTAPLLYVNKKKPNLQKFSQALLQDKAEDVLSF